MRELRERFVWILTGNDYQRWNISMSNCSEDEIHDAARGHIIIDSAFEMKTSRINPNRVGASKCSERTIFLRIDLLFQTAEELRVQLHHRDDLDRQTLHAYDAIWVIALLIR